MEGATERKGYFEGLSDDGLFFSGWCYDPGCGPEDKLTVAILVDGDLVVTAECARYREDLRLAGVPDPSVAFIAKVPEAMFDGSEREVSVVTFPDRQHIPGSPRRIVFPLIQQPIPVKVFDPNLVSNASFLSWPHGLQVHGVAGVPTECAAGWWMAPSERSEMIGWVWTPGQDRPLPPPFGLGLTLRTEGGKPSRLCTQLDKARLSETKAYLALELQPVGAAEVRLEQLAIGTGSIIDFSPVIVLQSGLLLRGKVRIERHVDLALILAEGDDLLLDLSLSGDGTVALYGVSVQPYLTRNLEPPEVGDGFEDAAIEAQLDRLTLPLNWSGIPGGAERTTTPSPYEGAPFTQIIIPVYNAASDVVECVNSVLECTESPIELVIIDDGSTNFTKHVLAQLASMDSRIRIYYSETNNGYTAAVNRAIASCESEWVVVLNSDVIVAPGWLDKLHEAMRASPRTAAVGPVSNAASWQSVPLTKDPSGEWAINTLPGRLGVRAYAQKVAELSERGFPEVPLLNGFCTLFRRCALERVGYLAERDFPNGYGEENDLSLRLVSAGFRLTVADHCYVHHKKSRSFGAKLRGLLGAAGHVALKRKHPGSNIGYIEEKMARCGPLITLRNRLAFVGGES